MGRFLADKEILVASAISSLNITKNPGRDEPSQAGVFCCASAAWLEFLTGQCAY
jgi:hypothetical protein